MDSVTTIVKPAPSWVGRIVDLGPIDQIAPRCYMTDFYCFRLAPGVEPAAVAERFQKTIFSAVQEIPQLAVTVVPRNNSREELELRWLETTGAYLVFKDYTSPLLKDQWPHGTFDDLAKDHFPYSKLERSTLMDGLTRINEQGLLPGLMLQVNVIPGGVLFVHSLHHTVCDGMGHYMTNTVLAKYCRDTPDMESVVLPIDFSDRASIITPDPAASLQDLPDWKLVPPGEEFLNPTHYEVAALPKLRCAIYYISEDRIAKLRATMSVGGRKPSVIESVGAALWMHVVRARNIDAKKYPEAKLSLTVNSRTRMSEPAISPTFWGNLCEPNAVARMHTAAFSESDTQFLPTAAQRIRGAIAAVDAPAVRRLVGLLSQLPKATSLTWNVDRWPGPDMLIVCLNSLPLNDLDFGSMLGNHSEAVRVQIGDIEGRPDGRCIVFPSRKCDGKGLEVMLQYDVDTLGRLEKDRSWGELFERRN
ncbi:hypothetical protein EJ05DRAFT_517867 [Pseudovirgaria hyperparasitica]|uniref:Trichothecene 3-O-acetyltransferase n=1 Tax=Pseudovirgaria hyperparasitica TaxID=470096 RepID=A0A6A6W4F7_9PEZI|nr:uncharacterized protein EJ05DRAFT_517867 [Pseudovirgaria hyperparasitica]KAF2756447.1 hypothetical protein EJ05DRAFT_517867 [Pseudovirgaria hyperparasitica]